MKKKLDISDWNRIYHFNFFKDYDNPFYKIYTNIEITEMLKFCFGESEYTNSFSMFSEKGRLAINNAILNRKLESKEFRKDLIHSSDCIPKSVLGNIILVFY